MSNLKERQKRVGRYTKCMEADWRRGPNPWSEAHIGERLQHRASLQAKWDSWVESLQALMTEAREKGEPDET